MKRSNIKKIFLLLIGIFGEVTTLIFMFFVKYQTHNLSLSKINLALTGNFINLLITLVIIVLLLLILLNIKQFKLIDLQIYLNLLFSSIILLLILVLLFAKDFYFLSMIKTDAYKFEKVISTVIWFIYLLIKFSSINYLLLKFLKVRRAFIPKTFILSSLYFGLIIIVAFIKINLISRTGEEYYLKKNEKFDALVVLGAAVWKGNIPSPIFQGRLEKAYELYKQRFSQKIILTGSNAPSEFSEARVGKEYLIKMGVEPEKIEIEEKTTSSIEQIHFIKRQLIEEKKFEKLLIISDAFHLPRVIEIAKFLSVDFKVSRSKMKIELTNNLWFRIRESVLLTIFWLFAV